MRPRLVFVHGIGGYRSVDAERDLWLRTLADGARQAGHSRLAADLFAGDAASVRFAYYRELFDRPQAQGVGGLDLDEGQATLLTHLLAEVVEAQLADSPPEQVRKPSVNGVAPPPTRSSAAGSAAPSSRLSS